MNIKLIRTPTSRAKLSKEFITRAVQNFSDVKAHNDWALSTIQILRRVPISEHCMSKCQSRYVF